MCEVILMRAILGERAFEELCMREPEEYHFRKQSCAAAFLPLLLWVMTNLSFTTPREEN